MNKLLYINTLKDLTPKTADIESVPIIRAIKERAQFPVSQDNLQEGFSELFISEDDIALINESLELIEPTIQETRALLLTRDVDYELINLERAINILIGIPSHLSRNLSYIKDVFSWQSQFINEAAYILNSIKSLRTYEEGVICNQRLNDFFEKILRNKEFRFNSYDIINEGQLEAIKGLDESMSQGYFLHFTLEEHLRKEKVNVIRLRIPSKKLDPVDNIARNITNIKRGVETAYKINMRMINWAILFYSYIKWVKK